MDAIDEYQRRIAELEEAVRARDAFIAVAAHELRNPMTPILGQIQLLQRLLKGGNCPPERIQAGLDRIEWLVEKYVRRATTLLDVSRITTGKLRFDPRPFHLATLMRELCNSFAPVAEYAGSSILLDVPDSISLTLDRLCLEQILDNLLSNAIKYGAGKPIDVTAEAQDDDILIRVRDRGIGIAEADRQRIFERFERAVGSGQRAGGFGVGLWIVRQLAEAMGGSVHIESVTGEGSTFTVRLPRQMGEMRE